MATSWRRAVRSIAGAAVLLIGLAGCSGSSTRAANGQPTGAPAKQQVTENKVSQPAPDEPAPVLEQNQGQPGGAGAAESSETIRKPAPTKLPWKPDPSVPLRATVSPTCVSPGGAMSITVSTGAGAGIAYQAVYVDNKGGSPPPYGGGYGGNDKGMADANGSFASSWTVAPNAPLGGARVDVIVGYEGKWAYAGPEFVVAAPGAC